MTVALHREHDAVRRAQGRLRLPTSPTARTPSSASTTCATTWPSRSSSASSAATPTRSWTRSTRSSIDEARTPLIISGEPETAAQVYYDFARVARDARRRAAAEGHGGGSDERASQQDVDFLYDEKFKTVVAARAGDREGRARAADREPLRPAQRPARQPPEPGAEGAGALPARRRLRHPGRRGEDRRRVHRPDHGGPPLVGGPAPGGRGEGGRRDPGGARHARDDHAPELLPPLREARRHDRHGEDRGEGVRRDLRPRTSSRSRPTSPVARDDKNDLIFKTTDGEVQRGRRRHQGAARATGSPSSSARSPSRPRSTSRSCSRAPGSRTTC